VIRIEAWPLVLLHVLAAVWVVVALAWPATSHSPEAYPYRGKITVLRLPYAEMLARCSCPYPLCNPPVDYRGGVFGGVMRGCARGGVLGFGGLRGQCLVLLDETATAAHEAHERAHCGGWQH